MAMEASLLKDLKIKTGAVRRLAKDMAAYRAEAERERGKLAAMAGGEPSDVKHQQNVVAEAAMMLPDCRQRLDSAVGDLQVLMGDVEGEEDGNEDVKAANEALKTAEDMLKEKD